MKRQQILETAARLFAERGYSRTSTSLLAAEAGVAEGTIFRHFKSKDDIFLQLLQNLKAKITTDVYQYLEVENPETGLEKILAIIKACYVFVRKNKSTFALILRDAPGSYGEADSQAFEHCRMVYQLLYEHFYAGIIQGQQEGNIRPELHPEDTTLIVVAGLVGVLRVVHLGFLPPSDDMLKHFVQCTEAMLAVPPKSSPRRYDGGHRGA